MTSRLRSDYESLEKTYPPQWGEPPLALISKRSGDNQLTTDKESTHSYGPVYDSVLTEINGRKDMRILEIGVLSGAFTQILHKLFPDAHIYGVDIDLRKYRYRRDNPMIHLHEMDGTLQETADFLNQTFDLIIEDGSHKTEDQIKSLDIFAPYLKQGGIFITEDIDGATADGLRRDMANLATKHNLTMQWHDLRSKKGRYDDIMAVFRKRS